MTRAGEQTRMRLGSSGESRSGTRHVRTQTRKTTRGACARRREKRRVARANADAKRRIPSLGARKRPSTLERRRILSRTPGFVPRSKLLPRWTAIPHRSAARARPALHNGRALGSAGKRDPSRTYAPTQAAGSAFAGRAVTPTARRRTSVRNASSRADARNASAGQAPRRSPSRRKRTAPYSFF